MPVCILDLHSVRKKKKKQQPNQKCKNNPYFLSVVHLGILLELSWFDTQ